MAVALDSSVVVAFLDRSDGLHEAADATLRATASTDQLVVSVITYAEVMTGARLGHHDERYVKGFFEEVTSRVLPVDVAVADVAARLRAQARSLPMPDALIAASAELDPDVAMLVTGDRKLARLKGLGWTVYLLSTTDT